MAEEKILFSIRRKFDDSQFSSFCDSNQAMKKFGRGKEIYANFLMIFPTSQQYDKFSDFFFSNWIVIHSTSKFNLNWNTKWFLNLAVNQKLNDELKLEKNCSIVSAEKFVSQLTSRSYFFHGSKIKKNSVEFYNETKFCNHKWFANEKTNGKRWAGERCEKFNESRFIKILFRELKNEWKKSRKLFLGSSQETNPSPGLYSTRAFAK